MCTLKFEEHINKAVFLNRKDITNLYEVILCCVNLA